MFNLNKIKYIYLNGTKKEPSEDDSLNVIGYCACPILMEATPSAVNEI